MSELRGGEGVPGHAIAWAGGGPGEGAALPEGGGYVLPHHGVGCPNHSEKKSVK